MREVKRRYWDGGVNGWVFADPIPSVEGEIFGLISRIEDEESFTPELLLALECLTEKQRFVIECKYGLGVREAITEREIAQCMGVRQRAVQKLEKRALRRLEKQMRGVVTDAS